MKRIVSFIALSTMVIALVLAASCSDTQSNILESQAPASQIELLSTDESTVIAMSEEDMVDSLYAEIVSMYEASGKEYDPEMVMRLAEFQARALLGTEIYLSEYEVEELPSTQDPQYGYMTLTTPKGTFYFLLPHCICGYVVPEEKYFGDHPMQMLTCGCTETLL